MGPLRRPDARGPSAGRSDDAHDVLIVGAGFAGLGTAIRLLQSGVRDVVILERSSDVGGTWRDNTYPGAACDIPSLLYSYSFAPNPAWSRAYSGSAEILGYIQSLVERHDLRRLIRFGTDVTALSYDQAAGVWTARTGASSNVTARTTHGPTVRAAASPSLTARSVVMASGPLSNASLPDLPGIAAFAGKMIHSARWDHGYDMVGKRVAVVGTGASAVQIIPELVDQVRSLKVFQRTPGWVLPRLDHPHPDWLKAAFRDHPLLQHVMRQAWFWGHESVALGLVWTSLLTSVVERVARAYLRYSVEDPWLRRQLTPDFRAGCKRMLISNDYYAALQRDNAKLVTWPIATLSPRGIRTADGLEHELDCIVFATGFDVTRAGTPFPITGGDGRSLAQEWSRGAHAYRSVAVAGYPNLFFTFGPNSGPGHNSALVYMEAQIDHIVEAVQLILDRDLRALEVKRTSQDRFNQTLQRRLARTTWNSGCRSWYLTDDGFNATMYPGFATQYTRSTAPVRLADYDLTPHTATG